jgi:glutamine synthetase
MELDEVLFRVAADGIEFVRFEQSDLNGISRSKTVPARHAAADWPDRVDEFETDELFEFL